MQDANSAAITKYLSLTDFDKFHTSMWPKWKPEVEFQYGGRLGSGCERIAPLSEILNTPLRLTPVA